METVESCNSSVEADVKIGLHMTPAKGVVKMRIKANQMVRTAAFQVDETNWEFDLFFTKFFKGATPKTVYEAVQAAGGALALVKKEHCRGRINREYALIFIPAGSTYKNGTRVVIQHARLPVKTDLQSTGFYATFAWLKTENNDYLRFVRNVNSTLGRYADHFIDAICVPGGFLVLFSEYSDKRGGLWLYTTQPLAGNTSNGGTAGLNPARGSVSTQIKSPTGLPATPLTLREEAIRLQTSQKNASMHTPTYRFEPCMLAHVMQTGNVDQTCQLIDQRKNVNYVNAAGKTALHEATLQTADLCVFQALMAAGANALCKNASGYTPLHLAIKYKNPDSVARLLIAGVDPQSVFGSMTAAIDFCQSAKTPACEHIMRAHHAKVEAQSALQSICDDTGKT